MESTHRHGRNQSVLRGRASASPSPGNPRPSGTNPLHDSDEGAPADIRAVRKPAEGAAAGLSPVCSERIARRVRPQRHADPVPPSAGEEPVRSKVNGGVRPARIQRKDTKLTQDVTWRAF